MFQHTYLTELECAARRADYLREARAEALAKQARQARPDSLFAGLAALFHPRSATDPAWAPAPAAGRDGARLWTA